MGFFNRLKNSFYENIGVPTDYEVAKHNLDNFNRRKQLADNELNVCHKVIEDIQKVLQIAEDDLVAKRKGGQLSYNIARQSLKVDMLKKSGSYDIDTIIDEDNRLKELIERLKYVYIDGVISGKIDQLDIKVLLSEIVSYCNTYYLFGGNVSITNSQRDLNYILYGIQQMIAPMEVNNITDSRRQQLMKDEIEIFELEEKYRKSKRR